MSKVLLIIDMQEDDLFPSDDYLANGISLISPDYDLVIATRDLHPGNHCSFIGYGGTFPSHCVRGTWGAKLLRNIDSIADIIISKGTDPNKEAFSGFDETVLDAILISLQKSGELPTEVDVVGVATEYCIRATVFDGFAMGFRIRVLKDLIRGIDPEASERTLQEFREAGIPVV